MLLYWVSSKHIDVWKWFMQYIFVLSERETNVDIYQFKPKDNLWIQENTGLTGTITEAYCLMNSVTLDCNNFQPQPVYPVDNDSGDTTFQVNCQERLGRGPKEYTCNFDDPVPFERPEDAPELNANAICGVPAVGT